MRKKWSIVLAAFLAISTLAGCSGSQANSAQDANSSTPASTEEKADTQANEEVTITVFHHIGEQNSRDALQRQLDAVSERNPGLSFENQSIDYSQFPTMLKTKIAGGDAPDLIFGRPKAYADIVIAGHVMPLDGQAFLDNVYETALESMKIDGKIYGAPTAMEAMGVFYNKDVFAAHNIEVPKTHSELIAAAEKLQAAGIIPFAHGFKEGWTAQCDFQSDFYGGPLSQNPTIYKEIMLDGKKFAEYPSFRESLQRNKDRLSFSSGDDFGTDSLGARNMLINGEAAMLIQGTWEIVEITNLAADVPIGFFTTPNADAAEKSLLGLASSGSVMVSSQCKYPEMAMKFLEFRATPEGVQLYDPVGNEITCVKGVPTENINPITADIMAIADTGLTYNYEAEDIFTGQYDATFRKFQEEFAADTERDVDAFIAKLDAEFQSIA